MLCFTGETRDLVHAVMRGGKDCHIGKSESVSFVREALGGLPIKSCLVRVRADSGFYNHEFLEYLGSKGHQYAVVAHAQEGMQHKIGGVTRRTSLRKGFTTLTWTNWCRTATPGTHAGGISACWRTT